MKLGFGKYKGSEIAALAESDPKYLIWLFTCDWVNQDTKKAIEDEFNHMTIEFGRHKGETVLNVKENDPKYYEWLTKPFVSEQFKDRKPNC